MYIKKISNCLQDHFWTDNIIMDWINSHTHTQVGRPSLPFSSTRQTLAFNFQLAEHNLEDEVMHNGVKWLLFISSTHEVKLCFLTKAFEPEKRLSPYCVLRIRYCYTQTCVSQYNQNNTKKDVIL